MKPPLTLDEVLDWLRRIATAAEIQATKTNCQRIQDERYGPVGNHVVHEKSPGNKP